MIPNLPLPNSLDQCIQCYEQIHYSIYTYTSDKYGIAMCNKCERKLKSKIEQARTTEKMLYMALLQRGIKAELQYFDGYKTIDIVILPAKLHIEVDGPQHLDPEQAKKDLLRTMYSLQNNFATLRVPNSIVYADLWDTTNIIVKTSLIRQQQFE